MTASAAGPPWDRLPVDRVSLHGITAHGAHGVLAEEKRGGQRFVADVVMHVPVHRAGVRDDLDEAVDYSVVAAAVHAVLGGESLDLVEAVAERIAAAVLTDDRVLAVDVTVHKPQAPLGVPFGDVTVQVHRTRADVAVAAVPADDVPVVLALGANLGDREATLVSAVRALGALDGVDVSGVSAVVETAPVGGPEQPRYLNAVLLARTTLSARGLLHACQDIEAAHARTREVRWGPRTLDVDLVAYGDLVVTTGDLVLPHPRARKRAFVLQPWLLTDPGAVLPGRGAPAPVAELLGGLRRSGGDVVVRPDLDLSAALVPAPVLDRVTGRDGRRPGPAVDEP